jgi:hypothetical protein
MVTRYVENLMSLSKLIRSIFIIGKVNDNATANDHKELIQIGTRRKK